MLAGKVILLQQNLGYRSLFLSFIKFSIQNLNGVGSYEISNAKEGRWRKCSKEQDLIKIVGGTGTGAKD